ncbi:MAG: carboxylating nicotinate-nucleotide diphosphorylase [Candidatus Mycalebacterium zealandia]|nr:MAG: carboxylating nicotinate-nucleotide diphosphorylase [Candidatus Mycalebacterium zealandia]
MKNERKPPVLDFEKVDRLIEAAVEEDVRSGDVTTELLFETDVPCRALVRAKQPGILAGVDVARLVFEKLDKNLEWQTSKTDGDVLAAGSEIVSIAGSQKHILTGERLALNVLQRLSGIATFAARFAEEVKGTGACVVDTRKTAPGLRELEKYAVRLGGCGNHRFGLYDGILIKDNHIKLAGGVKKAIEKVKSGVDASEHNYARFPIEVEAKELHQVSEAVEAGADVVMLDNMSVDLMKEAVRIVDGKILTEASGGVTLENVKRVASTGVDIISVGALTHSAPALDISLDMI